MQAQFNVQLSDSQRAEVARLVLEAANGPTTSGADAILRDEMEKCGYAEKMFTK